MSNKTTDDNVVNIFDGKPIEEHKYQKIYGLLESDNEKFHSLINHYQAACDVKTVKDPLVRKALAMEIQGFQIDQPIELIIKMSVLERELGFRAKKRTKEVIYDDIMFTLFKKSLVNYIETTLYDGDEETPL